MKKKYLQNAIGLTTMGIGVSVASQTLGDIGGTSAGYSQQGLGKVAKGMSAVGGIAAAGMTMDALSQMQNAATKKKKKSNKTSMKFVF